MQRDGGTGKKDGAAGTCNFPAFPPHDFLFTELGIRPKSVRILYA